MDSYRSRILMLINEKINKIKRQNHLQTKFHNLLTSTSTIFLRSVTSTTFSQQILGSKLLLFYWF